MSFKVLSSYPGWYATDLWASLSSFSRLLLASTQVSLDPQPLARLLLSSRALASPSWAWTWSPAPFGPRCSSPGPPPTSFKVFSTFPSYHGEKTMTINPTQRCFGSKHCIYLFKILLGVSLGSLQNSWSTDPRDIVLDKSSGIEQGWDVFKWPQLVCLLVTWTLVAILLCKGLPKVSKVRYLRKFLLDFFSPGSLDHIGRLLLPSLCPIHQRSFASSEL